MLHLTREYLQLIQVHSPLWSLCLCGLAMLCRHIVGIHQGHDVTPHQGMLVHSPLGSLCHRGLGPGRNCGVGAHKLKDRFIFFKGKKERKKQDGD